MELSCRTWWLYSPLHFNAPCLVCPDVLMEDKKMRFEKEFVGTGDGSRKLFRVKDSENKLPMKSVFLDEATIEEIVDWLNENIDKEEKSFNERVEEVIDRLWLSDTIKVSKSRDEYVIHEIFATDVTVSDIRRLLPAVKVFNTTIDNGRAVFIIKKR